MKNCTTTCTDSSCSVSIASNGKSLEALKNQQDEPSANDDYWRKACALRMTRHALRLNKDGVTHAVENLNLPWRDAIERVRASVGPLPEGMESPDEGRMLLAYRPYTVFCRDVQERRSVVSLDEFGFLGALLKPLERFIDTNHLRALHDSSQIADRAEKVDIRIGLFQTIEWCRNWRFFPVPSRIPLNVVMVESNPDLFAGEVNAAIHLFTGGTSESEYLRDIIEPVLMRGGSGYDFVVGTLGLQKVCTLEVLSPLEYAAKLTERGRGVRAAVVDLLTCIRILGAPNVGGKGRLLFPAPSALDGEYLLPEHSTGIAVNRRSNHSKRSPTASRL